MRKSLWAVLTLAVVAGGVSLWNICQTRGTNQPRRPNVILISIDTLRADHLSCYGYSRKTSPRLDAFARQSVRFCKAFCQASWTLPSHMSIMTSQYPHVHGVEEGQDALPEGATTLAEVLSAKGYRTAAFVSWIYLARKFGFAQGFDEFTELLPPPHMVDSTTQASIKAEQFTDYAVRWLHRDHAGPFFLFLHYFDPHLDYEPPPPYDREFDPDYRGNARGSFGWIQEYIKGVHRHLSRIDPRDLQYITALYDGEIRYTDTHLARLLEAIEATVGLDNTLVILTSDHGEEFDEHGSMEGHQWTLYDEVLHVPLIVHLPGGVEAGRVVTTPVQLIDIPSTILAWLGIEPPSTFQGADRSHLLTGPTPPEEPNLVFGEICRFNRKQCLRGPRYKLIHTDATGVNKRGIPVEGGYELYDLQNDPKEQDNIFDQESPVAKALIRLLEHYMRSGAANGDPEQAYEVQLSPDEIERLRSLGYVG